MQINAHFPTHAIHTPIAQRHYFAIGESLDCGVAARNVSVYQGNPLSQQGQPLVRNMQGHPCTTIPHELCGTSSHLVPKQSSRNLSARLACNLAEPVWRHVWLICVRARARMCVCVYAHQHRAPQHFCLKQKQWFPAHTAGAMASGCLLYSVGCFSFFFPTTRVLADKDSS